MCLCATSCVCKRSHDSQQYAGSTTSLNVRLAATLHSSSELPSVGAVSIKMPPSRGLSPPSRARAQTVSQIPDPANGAQPGSPIVCRSTLLKGPSKPPATQTLQKSGSHLDTSHPHHFSCVHLVCRVHQARCNLSSQQRRLSDRSTKDSVSLCDPGSYPVPPKHVGSIALRKTSCSRVRPTNSSNVVLVLISRSASSGPIRP